MERFSPSPLEECIRVPICAICSAYAFASSHICLFKVMGEARCISRNALCFSKPVSSSSENAENEGRKFSFKLGKIKDLTCVEPGKVSVEPGFHCAQR